MSRRKTEQEEDIQPLALLPRTSLLMDEAQRCGLDEMAHFLAVAIESLKDELAERAETLH